MKIYETDFGIRFILLIRVKKVIIEDTGEGLRVQGEAPKFPLLLLVLQYPPLKQNILEDKNHHPV